MRVHIMGSAAAEGTPAVWCNCEHCHKARNSGGKNIRSRSGALIDDVLKIDVCPDTYMQALRDGIDLSKVTDLLVTHSHGDHLAIIDLCFRRPPFAHEMGAMHIWGGERSIHTIRTNVGGWKDPDETLHVLQPFTPATLGDGTLVHPVRAAHDPNSSPLNYIIQRNGKTMLYGMDSGWYPEESWAAHQGYVFDLVLIDATMGCLPSWWGHGTLDEAVRIRERMLETGTAHANTVFYVNHFSHNICMLHDEIERYLAGTGIGVGYDGLVIEV